jgi:hypothetical protein
MRVYREEFVRAGGAVRYRYLDVWLDVNSKAD